MTGANGDIHAACAARPTDEGMSKQRSDALVDPRSNAIRSYRILATNIGNELVELRQSR